MKAGFYFLASLLFSFASSAETICPAKSNNAALIVIDMQPYFVTRGGNDQTPENKIKVDQIIKEQIAAIKLAEKAKIPIVFLEYDGHGDTNSVLKSAVGTYKEVKFFKKSTDGMFEDYNVHKKDLVDYLTSKQVGTLVITGANGGACVLQSITGALARNCSVVTYNKGIADFNFKDFIYPYVGQYGNIKPDCTGCSFKEVSSIDGIVQYIYTVNSSTSVSPPTSNKKFGTSK